MSTNIIFESLENGNKYYAIETFIQFHKGLKMINRQTISLEGAEDINHPLRFITVDGLKIPRYKVSLILSRAINLEPLTKFLESKRAFWLISSITLWREAGRNECRTTAKIETFLRNYQDMIFAFASKQLTPQAMPPPNANNQWGPQEANQWAQPKNYPAQSSAIVPLQMARAPSNNYPAKSAAIVPLQSTSQAMPPQNAHQCLDQFYSLF